MITGYTFAQSSKTPHLLNSPYPGTVTTTDGQIIKGYVISGSVTDNQKRCIFYTDLKDPGTRKEYSPNDLADYTIEDVQYKSMNYSGNIGFGKANRNFLFMSQPGRISTFLYYQDHTGQILWQRGDEESISNASMLFGFKKSLLKLVDDDPEIKAKVESKEKGYSNVTNLPTIIQEYNTRHTNNPSN